MGVVWECVVRKLLHGGYSGYSGAHSGTSSSRKCQGVCVLDCGKRWKSTSGVRSTILEGCEDNCSIRGDVNKEIPASLYRLVGWEKWREKKK